MIRTQRAHEARDLVLTDRVPGAPHLEEEESRMFAQGSPPELDDRKTETTRFVWIVRVSGGSQPVRRYHRGRVGFSPFERACVIQPTLDVACRPPGA